MEQGFTRLLQPGRIGSLDIKNRIVMAPMGTHCAAEDGHVVQKQIDYYGERAKGGVGLVMVEASCVQFPLGRGFWEMSVDDDKYLPGLTHLAEAIRKGGARAGIQLHHAGANTKPTLTKGATAVGPSTINRRGYAPARTLSTAEIAEIRDCFIRAARRVRKAGFELVDLHSAHAYILAEFLSPIWNERNDEYGGSIKNRARLHTEIISGIKSEMPELPVTCRFNGAEYGSEEYFGTPCLTAEDAREVAKLVEKAGADAVGISVFGWGRYALSNVPDSPGALLPLAEGIRKTISIPVIAAGRLLPDVAEKALAEGKTDFVAVGRGLLADPHFPSKLVTNPDDITPCIGCYECMAEPRRNICTVNASNLEEASYPYPILKARRAKNVVVVGGGPGGMEAARVAALRGHEVALFEKETELGGKLLVVDKPKSKRNLGMLNPYLKQQVEKAGVRMILGKAATAETVLQLQPDVVIIATGARPVRPDIQGLELAPTVDAIEFLAGRADIGNKVAIIGGELVGCEVAEVLAERGGKDVTILRRGLKLAANMTNPRVRHILLLFLREHGVKFEPGVTYKEAGKQGLNILDKDGKERLIEADTIVLAAGAEPDNRLALELKTKVPQVMIIGDAVQPRKIINALHEGFKAAYSL